MSQSHACVPLHIVFSTKNREPFLVDVGLRDALHGYMAGIGGNRGCPVLQVGGTADHIHVLCSMDRTTAIADLVKEVKRCSSLWVRKQSGLMTRFAWQKGYGAFAVGLSAMAATKAYIRNQEEHHRTRSFQEEYKDFLVRHGIEVDERFMWD